MSIQATCRLAVFCQIYFEYPIYNPEYAINILCFYWWQKFRCKKLKIKVERQNWKYGLLWFFKTMISSKSKLYNGYFLPLFIFCGILREIHIFAEIKIAKYFLIIHLIQWLPCLAVVFENVVNMLLSSLYSVITHD